MDVTLFHAINDLAGRNAVLDALFRFLTDLGTNGAIWIALALVLIVGAGRFPGLRQQGFVRWRAIGAVMLASLAVSLVVVEGLKRLVGRPRPFETLTGVHLVGGLIDGYSFPSGHTLSSFAAAVVLLTALSRMHRRGQPLGAPLDGWAAVLLAAAIGFSRVWVGHHYPLDVLAGAALGTAAGWGCWSVAERILRARSARKGIALH